MGGEEVISVRLLLPVNRLGFLGGRLLGTDVICRASSFAEGSCGRGSRGSWARSDRRRMKMRRESIQPLVDTNLLSLNASRLGFEGIDNGDLAAKILELLWEPRFSGR